VYSDVISISLLFFSMSGFIWAVYEKKYLAKLTGLVIFSLLLASAVQLRNNLIIVVIAFAITELCSKKKVKDKLIYLIIFIASFAIIASAAGALQNINGFRSSSSTVTPASRWVYMALNPDTQGQINGADGWKYETQGYSYSKKNDLYKRAIKRRLAKYDFLTLINHFFNKINLMFSGGWLNDTNFTQVDSRGETSWLARHIFLVSNIFRPFYVIILLLAVLAVYARLKKHDSSQLDTLSALSIVGIFSFHVFLWEAGERYSMLIIPFVLILSANSLDKATVRLLNFFKKNIPIIRRNRWYLIGLVLVCCIFAYFRNLNFAQQLVLNNDVVQSQPFTRYAMKEDYNLRAGSAMNFSINLPSQATQVSFPVSNGAFSDQFYAKRLKISLINLNTGKKYSNSLNHMSSINALFDPGKYRLHIQNISNQTIPTRMLINIHHANFEPILGKQTVSTIIPSFSFSKNVFRPAVNPRSYNLLWLAMTFGIMGLLMMLINESSRSDND
ncbi:MAG: hypothetical protein ABF808_08785, partial [Oenococcus sp.]